jgi:hypothetical protein
MERMRSAIRLAAELGSSPGTEELRLSDAGAPPAAPDTMLGWYDRRLCRALPPPLPPPPLAALDPLPLPPLGVVPAEAPRMKLSWLSMAAWRGVLAVVKLRACTPAPGPNPCPLLPPRAPPPPPKYSESGATAGMAYAASAVAPQSRLSVCAGCQLTPLSLT